MVLYPPLIWLLQVRRTKRNWSSQTWATRYAGCNWCVKKNHLHSGKRLTEAIYKDVSAKVAVSKVTGRCVSISGMLKSLGVSRSVSPRLPPPVILISVKNCITYLMNSSIQTVLMVYGVLISPISGPQMDLYTLIALWNYIPVKSLLGHLLIHFKHPQWLIPLIKPKYVVYRFALNHPHRSWMSVCFRSLAPGYQRNDSQLFSHRMPSFVLLPMPPGFKIFLQSFQTTKKARDGDRTRGPLLGKEVLHHWATRALLRFTRKKYDTIALCFCQHFFEKHLLKRLFSRKTSPFWFAISTDRIYTI